MWAVSIGESVTKAWNGLPVLLLPRRNVERLGSECIIVRKVADFVLLCDECVDRNTPMILESQRVLFP